MPLLPAHARGGHPLGTDAPRAAAVRPRRPDRRQHGPRSSNGLARAHGLHPLLRHLGRADRM
ncbi:MAG: hypothetical protein BWK77_02655, partial [Verrucomicrobia bacterium A1]